MKKETKAKIAKRPSTTPMIKPVDRLTDPGGTPPGIPLPPLLILVMQALIPSEDKPIHPHTAGSVLSWNPAQMAINKID